MIPSAGANQTACQSLLTFSATQEALCEMIVCSCICIQFIIFTVVLLQYAASMCSLFVTKKSAVVIFCTFQSASTELSTVCPL